MKRGHVTYLLRKLGLISFTDWVRYYTERLKNWKVNRDFKSRNPDVKLPPDYLIYESFQLNYQKYYTESIDTARWLMNHLNNHIELQDKRILDWGCGPGRIIRHLPAIINNGCEYFGTDINEKSIAWCSKNLTDINFNKNSLEAKLPYDDNFIDVIYGISVLTHLSEQLNNEWYKELYRTLKPGGIMLLTTQGDNFIIKLTDNELKRYKDKELVVRGDVKEGHRTYSTFHPEEFMIKLFDNVKILEHIMPPYIKGNTPPQDIWIIRKK